MNNETLLDKWVEIGNKNFWIQEAFDPSFEKAMLQPCETLIGLEWRLSQGNWCLGQGFYYQNLCFINQVEGGDEWLAIKDEYDFESITFKRIIQRGEFTLFIQRLLNATKEDCINLTY